MRLAAQLAERKASLMVAAMDFSSAAEKALLLVALKVASLVALKVGQ